MLLERDQQRDQAKGKALSRAQLRNINLDFSLEEPRWLPLGWLILRQTKRGTRLGSPSLPSEFFTPTLSVCTDSLSGQR